MPPIPTISVVIAAYNAADFIGTAIDSVVAQTLAAHEIVVVNDASTDSTADVVSRRAADLPSLRLVNMPENGGPAAARNLGIDHATGDWIAILDADDIFEPKRLELLSRHFDEADILADDSSYYDLIAQAYVHTCLDKSVKSNFQIDLTSYLKHGQGTLKDWSAFKPVFRREFLNQHALRYPVGMRHGEDFDLIINCLLATPSRGYLVVPQALYRYTMREGAISRSPSGLSRTRVDYAGIAAASRRWARDPRIAGTPAEKLFLSRAVGFDRIVEGTSMLQHIRQRRIAPLLRMIVDRPAFAIRLGRHIIHYGLWKLGIASQ